MINRFFRLNYQIQSPTLRVIDETGKQIGIFPKEEALKKAQDLGLDLIEIAPKANPAVGKIMDFKKFQYLEAKKLKKAGKRIGEIKEIRLTPFIGVSDFSVRLKKAEEFLKDGHGLKVVVKFTGRQMQHTEFGQSTLKRFVDCLTEISKLERPFRFEGRTLVASLVSVKKN